MNGMTSPAIASYLAARTYLRAYSVNGLIGLEVSPQICAQIVLETRPANCFAKTNRLRSNNSTQISSCVCAGLSVGCCFADLWVHHEHLVDGRQGWSYLLSPQVNRHYFLSTGLQRYSIVGIITVEEPSTTKGVVCEML